MMLSEKFKGYSKLFKKYSITDSDINSLDENVKSGRFTIQCTVTTYTKKDGYKTFSSAEVETETSNISAEFYYNCITGILFFNDRVTMGYTFAGYMITSLVCYNPDKTKKLVRIFKIIKND